MNAENQFLIFSLIFLFDGSNGAQCYLMMMTMMMFMIANTAK